MAKMASLSGAVTGKLAGNVYSVNSGQQIVRAYQPNVANPSTEQQVTTRAKFKLASQLAAAVSPVLAIAKIGLVSGRNQFVSDTMGKIRMALGNPTMPMQEIQLTKSSILLPAITTSTGQDNHLEGHLVSSAVALGVTKVVYARFAETSAAKLLLLRSQVVSTPGADGRFTADLGGASTLPTIIYAYGIIEDENNVLAKYEDYQLEDASFLATLVSSRTGMQSGLRTTTTSAHIIPTT